MRFVMSQKLVKLEFFTRSYSILKFAFISDEHSEMVSGTHMSSNCVPRSVQ